MKLNPVHINHLFDRACFGVSFERFQNFQTAEIQSTVESLFESAFQSEPLTTFGDPPNAKILAQVRSGMTSREEARRMIRDEIRSSANKIRALNIEWVSKMQQPAKAGLEKLVYFWHDHFGVRVINGYLVQGHNNVLRANALGSYRDLLAAVAQDAAMLSFLNNQQNVKAKPNENFARELLELYTLGRGHYTEQDVKEAARAFTGWRMNRRTNEFVFDKRNHDTGTKTFLGRRGNFDGDDIIDILLENRQTARFLAEKFYGFYVADEPNEEHIAAMAVHYYAHNYDTASLLKYIFTQSWFYEKKQIQAKIKSPIELINGLHAQLGLDFTNPVGWLLLQRNYSQVMFYPPSVSGWPKGREWIDSSSLVNRMKLPALLIGLERSQVEESPELDATDPFQKIDRKQVMESAVLGLWSYKLPDIAEEDQVKLVSSFFFNKPLPNALHAEIVKGYQKQSQAQKKYWLFTTLASLPEYQMI